MNYKKELAKVREESADPKVKAVREMGRQIMLRKAWNQSELKRLEREQKVHDRNWKDLEKGNVEGLLKRLDNDEWERRISTVKIYDILQQFPEYRKLKLKNENDGYPVTISSPYVKALGGWGQSTSTPDYGHNTWTINSSDNSSSSVPALFGTIFGTTPKEVKPAKAKKTK